jgi:hypothetical protein
VELHAAGVLAALAAAAFGSQCTSGRRALVLLGSFVAAALSFARFGALDTAALGFSVGAAALAALARPRWLLLPPLAAGISAAAWVSILEAQGLPLPAGVVAAAIVVAVAAGLATRRAAFASAELCDEALVLVGAFALLLAVVPDVVDGWRASVALKAEPLAAAGPETGPWLGAVVLAAVALGGAYSVWKRR